MHHCDLPTYRALCAWWAEVPPVPQQLQRIATYLGPPAPEHAPAAPAKSGTPPAISIEETLMEASMAGLPVFQGRPADPALDLIPPAPTPSP